MNRLEQIKQRLARSSTREGYTAAAGRDYFSVPVLFALAEAAKDFKTLADQDARIYATEPEHWAGHQDRKEDAWAKFWNALGPLQEEVPDERG